MEDFVAKRADLVEVAPANAPDRSRLAKSLASAWPGAEVVQTLRAGAAQALDLFVAGDVVGARKRWAEVGALLTRRPPGKRGKARMVTHEGRTLNVSAWARELGWSVQALSYRLDVMPLAVALVPRDPKA